MQRCPTCNAEMTFDPARQQLHRERCAADVPGDTQRHLRVSNRFGDRTFEHVLVKLCG